MADFSYKNFTETDFETIKDSLKEYLKSQDIFKDFDFDGSAMNVLLNILAYNTQYNSYYLNMAAGEKFINYAQKRESVVGLANNLGYIPRSAQSATSYLTFDIVPDDGFTSLITIPKNVKFTTTIDGVEYAFLTTAPSTYAIDPISGTYHVENLEVKEGRFFTHRFAVTEGAKFFEIPNLGVDMNRLKVYVKSTENAPDISKQEYKPYASVLDVNANSLVYYTQEVDNRRYQIYFGDGVLGSALSVGNQVIIEYYITAGALANGATAFTLDDEFTGVSDIINLEATRSSFGLDQETTEQVRTNSTLNYTAQNRAVIAKDYEFVIRRLISNISDVSVWGGEDATPKQYGKVFISAIKENFNELTQVEKNLLIRELRADFSVLSITPEFVDIETVNVIFDVNLIKKPNSDIGNDELISTVTNTIKSQIVSKLSKFNVDIYESRVEEIINDSSSDIASSRARFRLYYDLNEKILIPTANKIQFPVAIEAGSVSSNTFTYNGLTNCYIQDTGDGFASVYQNNIVVDLNVLTINYSTGIITHNKSNLLFNFASQFVRLVAKPELIDVSLTSNFIGIVDDSDILVTI